MKASLILFINGLTELRYYIKGIQSELQLSSLELNELAPMKYEALLLELKENLIYNNTNKKRFEYNTSIISLYGFFEQYIESIIRLYLYQLNEIVPEYQKLPEMILKNQVELSLKLMAPAEQARYHGKVTTQKLIANLHSCFINNRDYCINVEAFSHHNSNFRSNIVQEAFARIGIENITDRALKCPSFLKYWSKKYPEDRISPENPRFRKRAISLIDELADRRNDVAHGMPTDDLLSNELILDRIDFFEAYGNAIFEIANSCLLSQKVKLFGQKLGKTNKIFEKNIFVISAGYPRLKLGDTIIAEPSNKNYPLQIGEIKEIQIDGKSFKEIPAEFNKEIAIRVSFVAKRNQTLFLISTS